MKRWEHRALCKDVEDPTIFFNRYKYKEAQAVCKSCPVKRECLDFAMREEADTPLLFVYGVFGGLTPRARVERRKNV